MSFASTDNKGKQTVDNVEDHTSMQDPGWGIMITQKPICTKAVTSFNITAVQFHMLVMYVALIQIFTGTDEKKETKWLKKLWKC